MNRTIKLSLIAILLATAFTGCKDPENNENNVEIKVTTYMPIEITATTAQCGGHVTITGTTTARIAELGVCWGTEEDPVATDSHLSTTVTNEPFNCTIEGLMPETQYHVRAYALYESEYYYGEDLAFTTLADNGGGGGEEPNLPEGITQGLFSVSENLRVHFSQGNLQYQASTRTWRFAESQLDYIGEGNANIGETYDGWIDLFGWGASGYNHGANAYQPWSTSGLYSDYYAYGNGCNNLFDQTGQADWGYNAISNGGNQTGIWRTLIHIQIKNGKRDELARYLRERGVYTTYRYFPLHRVPGYGVIEGSFPNADYAADNTLCLPLHQSLTKEDVEKVISTIREFGKTC